MNHPLPLPMNRSRLQPACVRLLLAIFVVHLLAASVSAQSTLPDTTAPRDELLAQRPATLKRPPPELSAPAAKTASRSASAGRSASDRTAQAEVLPPATRAVPAAPSGPTIILPGMPEQGYVMDDPDGYGALDGYPAYDYDYGLAGPAGGRFWVRGEYLLWWVEGMRAPPLVTTSTAGTPQADAGILGLPSTSILFADRRLLEQYRHGVRLTAGGWFGDAHAFGAEASAFWLMTDHDDFSANSGDFPILARPFFNVEPGFEGPDAEIIAYPGLFVGQIDVASDTSLFGGDVLLRACLCQDCYCRVDGLLGARYARLEDTLQISDNRTVIGAGAGVAIGTTFRELDLFETRNEFIGGELGFSSQMKFRRFWLEGVLKLALGVNRSRVQISGQSTATIPVPGGAPIVVNTPAGLLAQQTNIGVYKDDSFSVIPEVGLTVGFEITPRLRATAGYTFFYWTDVLRAGDQIDTNLNLSQLAPGGLVGIPRPQFTGVTDDLWVQGLSLGLDFRF